MRMAVSQTAVCMGGTKNRNHKFPCLDRRRFSNDEVSGFAMKIGFRARAECQVIVQA